MKIERGRATLLSASLKISGGGTRNSQIRTTHVSVLKLNGRTAEYSGDPLPIGEGEDSEIIAAGRLNADGIFKIHAAYFPALDMIRHNVSVLQPIVAVLFMIIAGFFGSMFFAVSGDSLFFLIIPAFVIGAFFVIGGYMIYSYFVGRKALGLVRAERMKFRPTY